MFDRDLVCFPLRGCLKHVEVNKKSLFHASTELLLTTSFRRVVSLELHNRLADFGIRRNTLTLWMNAIADVELGEGPRSEDGVEETCHDEVRDDDDTAWGPRGNGGTEGDDDITGGLGVLPEPRHRAASGP